MAVLGNILIDIRYIKCFQVAAWSNYNQIRIQPVNERMFPFHFDTLFSMKNIPCSMWRIYIAVINIDHHDKITKYRIYKWAKSSKKWNNKLCILIYLYFVKVKSFNCEIDLFFLIHLKINILWGCYNFSCHWWIESVSSI